MEPVRMLLHWDVDAEGHLTSHWAESAVPPQPVDLATRRRDPEGALERAASYVRRAPAAG